MDDLSGNFTYIRSTQLVDLGVREPMGPSLGKSPFLEPEHLYMIMRPTLTVEFPSDVLTWVEL